MSCAATDVADRIARCLCGASDPRLDVEFGDGKMEEMANTTFSICSIEGVVLNNVAVDFGLGQTRPDSAKVEQHPSEGHCQIF